MGFNFLMTNLFSPFPSFSSHSFSPAPLTFLSSYEAKFISVQNGLGGWLDGRSEADLLGLAWLAGWLYQDTFSLLTEY